MDSRFENHVSRQFSEGKSWSLTYNKSIFDSTCWFSTPLPILTLSFLCWCCISNDYTMLQTFVMVLIVVDNRIPVDGKKAIFFIAREVDNETFSDNFLLAKWFLIFQSFRNNWNMEIAFIIEVFVPEVSTIESFQCNEQSFSKPSLLRISIPNRLIDILLTLVFPFRFVSIEFDELAN